MTTPTYDVGAYVWGGPYAPRTLVRHADLLAAYADGTLDDEREAYLSHFTFGKEMEAHHAATGGSVAGYSGPCCCRWLVLDIDRADPAAALADARRLVTAVQRRYDVDDVPVWFSGNKGYHVVVLLSHEPPPAVGFHRVARTFAESLATAAGVQIDTAIYDVNRIVRLPNTRHPKTSLFKRRIDTDVLLTLSPDGIRGLARHPSGEDLLMPTTAPPQLVADWAEAEAATTRLLDARPAVRRSTYAAAPDQRAPRYFLDLLRFGVEDGERARTLFRCAAWLTEQGAPPSLSASLLTEPGLDAGLPPSEVARQIRSGIDHARRQRVEEREGGLP